MALSKELVTKYIKAVQAISDNKASSRERLAKAEALAEKEQCFALLSAVSAKRKELLERNTSGKKYRWVAGPSGKTIKVIWQRQSGDRMVTESFWRFTDQMLEMADWMHSTLKPEVLAAIKDQTELPTEEWDETVKDFVEGPKVRLSHKPTTTTTTKAAGQVGTPAGVVNTDDVLF